MEEAMAELRNLRNEVEMLRTEEMSTRVGLLRLRSHVGEVRGMAEGYAARLESLEGWAVQGVGLTVFINLDFFALLPLASHPPNLPSISSPENHSGATRGP